MNILEILEIESKTDILAFTAFLISLLSIGDNVQTFLQGYNVVLFPPTSLVVTAVDYEEGATSYISIISRFSYSNNGDNDYSSIITDEVAEFRVGGRQIEQGWHAFVATTTESSVLNLAGKITPIFEDIAAPFVVRGGDSESHETLFASRTTTCQTSEEGCNDDHNFVPITEFVDEFAALTEEAGPSATPFEVVLAAEVIGEGLLRDAKREQVKCIVMIRLQDLDDLKNRDVRYFSRPCV